MPNFIVSNVTTTAQTLAADQSGFVATGATLVVTSTATHAVSMSRGGTLGLSKLTVMGTVHAENATPVSTGNGVAADAVVIIGAQGAITSDGLRSAIDLALTQRVMIQNAGLILGAVALNGESGIDITQTATVMNTGQIASNSNFYSTIDFGDLEFIKITNVGTIASAGSAAAIAASGYASVLEVTNSGTISSDRNSAIVAAATLSLDNTATILGDVAWSVNVTIRNAGLIRGSVRDFSFGATGDLVVLDTSGQIDGDIALDGNDRITLRNTGTITRNVDITGTAETTVIVDNLGGDIGGRLSVKGSAFVTNSGLVRGDLQLDSGDDTYNGLGGGGALAPFKAGPAMTSSSSTAATSRSTADLTPTGSAVRSAIVWVRMSKCWNSPARRI